MRTNARLRAAAMALAMIASAAATAGAQSDQANYDEAKVGNFPPLDPLTTADGKKVTTPETWGKVRWPELLRLFETEMYGRIPEAARSIRPTYQVRSEDSNALGGKAIRREVTIRFTSDPEGPRMDLLVYLPKRASAAAPAPAFVGLNFGGNQTVDPDPGIALGRTWTRPGKGLPRERHTAAEKSRGTAASRWAVERIIDRGYALATAHYEDIEPDFDGGYRYSVRALLDRDGKGRPAPDEWGAIGAWAWGLSRALDYLETVPEVDARKVAVMGHSRLGKTALWAGVIERRFALVISNNSGCGGAALSRRIFGETVGRMNRSFPHWLCANFQKYSDREADLPFDQNELIALIAPRPVLVCSADEDLWADPKGEFLGALGADPVYRLLGTDGLAVRQMPRTSRDGLVNSTIGYRIRPGKHDVTPDDWEAYLNFADRHFHHGSQ